MRPVSAGPLRKRQRLKVKAAVPLESMIYGAPGGNRTPDQRFRKPLLYPSELQARA